MHLGHWSLVDLSGSLGEGGVIWCRKAGAEILYVIQSHDRGRDTLIMHQCRLETARTLKKTEQQHWGMWLVSHMGTGSTESYSLV